jgi:hypothetical protein
MSSVEQVLSEWNGALASNIPVAGLMSRNRVAYKWKSCLRVWMLREVAFWRFHDLLTQSFALHQQGYGLGARILLRSGLETLAVLIYLNQLLQQVLDGKLNFHVFGKKTSALLLGSRDGSTAHQSVNIMTILQRCDRTYPGIERLYAALSESAHPNFEGMVFGYSEIDSGEYETRFSNRWMDLHGDGHLASMETCMSAFQYEYNNVWPALVEMFEGWVEANDAELEATKNDPLIST